jgi:hypothetical protein
MHGALALLALALAAPTAAAAADPPPLTWARLRTMTPEAVARSLFGDVGQIMYLRPFQMSGTAPPRWPLRSLSFLTRPRASYRAGVCETDWVDVEFEPAPFALGPDPGVRPRRFRVMTQYLVQDLAKVREGGPAVEEEAAALERACAVIDPREASAIIATTAFDITGTVGLLANLIDAARQGRTTAPILCRDHNREPIAEADCLRNLARLRPERLASATLTAGCGRNEIDLYCRQASVWDGSEIVEVVFELRRGSQVPARVLVDPRQDTSAVE